MAKKVKRKNSSAELEKYKRYVVKKLDALIPLFARASIGDFSKNVTIPEKIDEFTELYVGIQLMLEVNREKISALKEFIRILEKKVNRRSSDLLMVKADSRLVKINRKEILYIKAMGDYVTIHTSSERFTVYSTMKGMLGKLPAKEFLRVHHSYIVRLNKISRVEKGALIIGNYKVPVSRPNRKKLVARFKAQE